MNDETLAALQMQMLMFTPCLLEVGVTPEQLQKAMEMLENKLQEMMEKVPDDDTTEG